MNLFKLTRKFFVFLAGIIYYWIILTLLADICFPYLASHGTEVRVDNSSARLAEGSGDGSLLDILGLPDDDSTDDSNYETGTDERTAGGGDDGGGGLADRGLAMPDVKGEELSTPLYIFEVMCFRCHGDGINGCDVITMMQDIQTYSVSCLGKCLNLSSGSMAVYDCAHDMLTHTDSCLQNGDTEMCFCSGDFCNGPSALTDSTTNFSKPFLFPKHPLLHGDFDHNYEIADDTEKNVQMNNLSTAESLANNTNNKLNSSRITGTVKENAGDNISNSYEYELFPEDTSDATTGNLSKFQPDHKSAIDFIISQNNNSSFNNNSRSSEVTSIQAININDLHVGNLKDSSVESDSGQPSSNVTVFTIVIAVVCSVFTRQHVS